MKLSYFIIGMFCILGLESCGNKPVAKRQPISEHQIPEWPLKTGGLSLADDSAAMSYQGSVVMWAPDVSAEGIAEVVSASANNRAKRAALMNFRVEKILPLETQRTNKAVQIADERAASKVAASARQREIASNWFESKLDAMTTSGQISVDEAARSRQVFERYCEAKIWEFVSARLALEKGSISMWEDRPSPGWFCESVYKAKGLLVRDGSERCAKKESGDSYESCLWHEGLLKTSFFVGRFDGVFEKRPLEMKSAKFFEWVEAGVFRAYFNDVDAAPGLRTSFMNAVKVRVSSQLAVNGKFPDNIVYGDVFIPSTGPAVDAYDAQIARMSPQFLINQIEDLLLVASPGSSLSIAKEALLIPGADADSSRAAILNDLRAAISALHRRDQTASLGDLMLGKALSPLVEPIDLAGKLAEPTLTSLVNAIDSAAKLKIDNLVAEEAELTLQIESARQDALPLEKEWTSALKRGALAASAAGVSTAFFTSSKLELRNFYENKMRYIDVRFVMDKGVNVLSACWLLQGPTGSAGAQAPCPKSVTDSLGGAKVDALLAIDLEKSKLSISADLAEPSAVGLGLRTGGGDQAVRATGFNQIDMSEIQSPSVLIELFGNSLNGMPYFTGKVFIRDGSGATLHEGASSLMPYN